MLFSLCWPSSHSIHSCVLHTRGFSCHLYVTDSLPVLPASRLRDNTVKNCLPPPVHGPVPPTSTSLFAVYESYPLTQPHCDGCSVTLLLKCHRAATSLLPGRRPELRAALVSPERVLGCVSVALQDAARSGWPCGITALPPLGSTPAPLQVSPVDWEQPDGRTRSSHPPLCVPSAGTASGPGGGPVKWRTRKRPRHASF